MPNTATDDQATRCTHCPRLLREDKVHRYACHLCEDRAATQLRAMPDLYEQLGVALTPGSTHDRAGRVSGSSGSPLPAALQPLSLRGPGGIVDMLLGIEQRWRIQLDWDPIPDRGGYEASLAGCVPILVNSISWICDTYHLVADDLKLINSLHQQAETVIHGPREQRVPIGHCPISIDDGPACGEQLKVSPWALEIRCTGCGTRWPRSEWLALGATMRGLDPPSMTIAA